MVLIVTRDLELAKKLGEVIRERKSYVVGVTGEDDVSVRGIDPHVEIDDKKARSVFRHEIHACQPEVVVLDVRFGGNRYQVLDEVPAITGVRSGPAVVLLLPWSSDRVRDEAARRGCFDVLIIGRRTFWREIGPCVSEALSARAAGALDPSPLRAAKDRLH